MVKVLSWLFIHDRPPTCIEAIPRVAYPPRSLGPCSPSYVPSCLQSNPLIPIIVDYDHRDQPSNDKSVAGLM